MADEPPHDPIKDIWWIIICLLILTVAWVATGASKKTDLRGIFLNPPPPVGPGGAYGPKINTASSTQNGQPIDSYQGQNQNGYTTPGAKQYNY